MITKNDEGYDPEWLALEASLGSRPVLTGDIPTDKKIFDEMGEALAGLWPKLSEELTIADWDIPNSTMKVRSYKPTKAPDLLPMMIYFHGGGWVSGNLDTEDPQCQILAAKTPCVLLSVDYPLAPPATLQEIIECGERAVEWVIENASRFQGADSSRILVAGGSAGGALTTQVVHSIVAEQASQAASRIKGCISMFGFCSPFDYSGPFEEDFIAHRENAEGVPLIPHHILVGMYDVVKADFTSSHHFPLLESDELLARMPPMYFMSAEKDPCRDDATVLAERLTQLGVPTKLDYYPGFPHYFHWFPQLNKAHEAMVDAVKGAQWLLTQEVL